MIDDTIAKIEETLKSASISEERRRELLQLVGTLKAQMGELSSTHEQQANHIAGLAEVSAREATRPERNPELVGQTLKRLSSSVQQFETSHPQLVQIVNAICTSLANAGI